MLPLKARVDLATMVTKGNSAFPNLQHYSNLTIRFVCYIIDTRWEFYPFAEKQSAYSATPTDWAILLDFSNKEDVNWYFGADEGIALS